MLTNEYEIAFLTFDACENGTVDRRWPSERRIHLPE